MMFVPCTVQWISNVDGPYLALTGKVKKNSNQLKDYFFKKQTATSFCFPGFFQVGENVDTMFVGQSAGWLLWDPDFESCLDQMPSVYRDLKFKDSGQTTRSCQRFLILVWGYHIFHEVVEAQNVLPFMILLPKSKYIFKETRWNFHIKQVLDQFSRITAGGDKPFLDSPNSFVGARHPPISKPVGLICALLWRKDTDISLEEVPVARFRYLNGWCHQV